MPVNLEMVELPYWPVNAPDGNEGQCSWYAQRSQEEYVWSLGDSLEHLWVLPYPVRTENKQL